MKQPDLTIGMITALDPTDKRSWSGVYHQMSKVLKQEFSTVVLLGPVKLGRLNYFRMDFMLFFQKVFHVVFLRKRFNSMHNNIKSRFHGRYFDKKIKEYNVDVLFAPSASVEIANLKSKIPICYFADTTFAQLCDYYSWFSNFTLKEKRIGNRIEQAAISNSTTQVFSSEWAFSFAKTFYRAKNPFIVKMGANLDFDPPRKEKNKKGNPVNILFVGIDWKRKGGDIVLDTVDLLYKKGYNINLTVCGCNPPIEHPKMKVIPYLDKNIPEDSVKFEKLFEEADLFFMPSRAECYGIVFCEANAYGLPVITTDTGGVSSIIRNGVNGFILPKNASSLEYYKVIERLITEPGLLMKISKNAYYKYKKELNWNHWGREIKKILLLTKELSN